MPDMIGMAVPGDIEWGENYDARLRAYRQLEIWHCQGHDVDGSFGITALMKLFGYKDAQNLRNNMTSEHRNLIDLLCGPNGWAIYQMLKARNND